MGKVEIDLENFIEEEKKWKEKHPILFFIREIYYWCYRNLNLMDWYREIKYFLQRIFRGYSDRDLWGMNTYLGNHILKNLKAFRSMKRFGYPACFYKEESTHGDAEKKWNKILNEMIEGWEYITTETYDTEIWKKYFERKEITYEQYIKESKILYDIAEKKAMLFVKYFNSLWD